MSEPTRQGIRARCGAWLWLLCAQFFVVEAVATLGWTGHYSYRNNFISDLGSTACGPVCSHWHALMNASFFLQGTLIAGGALLLPRKVSPGRLGVVSRVFLLLASLGIFMVAHAPENVDMNMHIFGANLHFLCGSAAMLCWGLALLRGRRRYRPQARLALLAAAIASFGDLMIFLENSQTAAMLGSGTIERIAAYPFPLWLVWMGFSLLRAQTLSASTPGSVRDSARDL